MAEVNYMYMCMLSMCLHNLFQSIIKQFYITIHIDAFTLHAKHVTVKVHGSTFLRLILWTHSYVISSQDDTVQEYVITWCRTHKNKCVLSHCRWLLYRVFLYAYDIETAVKISCRTSNLLSNACVLIIHHIFTHIAAYVYFSTPINVGTVIVSFINN